MRERQGRREMEAEYWRIVKDKEGQLLRIDDAGGREPKTGETRRRGQQAHACNAGYLPRLT